MTTPRRSRTYLTLYFNLERAEDLDLLTLLYALPTTRRGATVKSLLRVYLAAYLHAHHPDRPPLDRQVVRDLVATRARTWRRRRRGARADDGELAAVRQPVGESDPLGKRDPTAEEPPRDAKRSPSDDTEARFDRFLQGGPVTEHGLGWPP